MAFQLGSALLDACVLSVLDQSDTYGYAITQEIQQIIDVSESSLYPVLRRLQKDGYLETYDKPFQGRNRRYYSIQKTGREKLSLYRSDWQSFRGKVDHLLMGGQGNETNHE